MARSRSPQSPPVESAAPGAVLLALDLQSSLLAVMSQSAALRTRCQLVLQAATGLGIPVLFTEQVPAKLGSTDPEIQACAPQAQVLPKTTFSAMADGAILKQLRAMDCEHLLIIGLETPVCVYQTALHALAEDFQVTVLTDAIGARRPADAESCLRSLATSGVHLLPAETVLYALLHDAEHPFFKTLIKLVKTYV